jgi:hypothetical protein
MAKTITIESEVARRWAEAIEAIHTPLYALEVRQAHEELTRVHIAIRDEVDTAEKLAERTLDTHAEYATREEANS